MSTASQPLEPDLSGRTLERYRLIRRLGIGGMGAVYEGEHTTLEKRVAVKVLRHDLTKQEVARKRFLREAKAATRVKHPNVVDISDFGEAEDGLVFFAMELLTGKDLSVFIHDEVRLPWSRTQKILLQVVSALDAAHAQGIVHRDMKPSNCFLVDVPGLENADFIKVLDFGIAKVSGGVGDQTGLTSTDEVFGTVAYMAPEMVMGTSDDPRSDIYAVGVMMYRMLTGRLPFTHGNAFQILSQHINVKPPRPREKEPSIPEEIEAIVLKALEKRVEDRFQTMKQLAEALRCGRLPDELVTRTSEPATQPTADGATGVTSGQREDTVVLGSQVAAATAGPREGSDFLDAPTISAVRAAAVERKPAPTSAAAAVDAQEPSTPTWEWARKTRVVEWAALAVCLGVGAVLVVANTGNEGEGESRTDASTVTLSPSPPSTPPVQTPSVETVDPVEPAPTLQEAAEVPSDAEAVADEEELIVLDDEEPGAGGHKKPKKKPKAPTDEAVIARLEQRIAQECTTDGTTSVRLEGLITAEGRVHGALATPKAGPGSCAEKLLKTARFAPRAAMTSMQVFSVKL